jgi:hypothetical protein
LSPAGALDAESSAWLRGLRAHGDEFNLAATRPDLLTGVDPATGNPAPYGSVGVEISCAVIGFIDKAPTANLADPVPNSQFPPR